MFNRNRCLLKFIYSRCYTTKSQRSVLLQDVEKCPTYEFPTSNKSTRRVYVWGMSETGALGVNTDLKKHSKKHTAIVQHPTRLSFAERNNVLNIATGYGFTVFVTKYSEGYSLYGVGINSDSQLGYHLRGKNSKGNLELLIYPAPIDLPKSHEGEVIQITKCAAGRAHLLALSDKGVVYSLGNNAYGQCGRPVIENEDYRESSTVNRIETVGLTNEQIFDITCGQDHSLFLTKDGKVFGCGWGADGQTGLGMFQSIDKPARVLGDISSEKIVKVSGTVDCVLALNDKGELFGWGNSEYGQIGNEQQVNLPRYIETKGIGKIIDVASGGSYCVILNAYEFPTSNKSTRRVYVWGMSETGALGVNTDLKKHSKKHTAIVQHPTRLSFAERNNVLNIATGYGFTVFVTKYSEGYSLYGVGINSDSQLGYHLRGKNSKGNLELLIYPAPIDLPKSHEGEVIQITKCAAGRAHLLALSDKGVVYSLGNNAYGQCGRPVIENEDYRESSTVNRIETVGLTNEQIFDITCGQDHSLFLTKDGKVFGCGWGADGQTGLGMFQSIDKPARVLGDISSEKIVKVSGTVDCVLALNDKGELFGWGNSEYGQIGNEQQVNLPRYIETKGIGKIIDVASGGSYCVILNENGDVFVWGFGILGLGPNAQLITKPTQIPATLLGRNEFNRHCRVRSIHSGISHIGAVNDQNDVYMWGRNKCGCLGLGHKNDQYFPFKAAIGAQVLNINCGVDHTIALCQPFT